MIHKDVSFLLEVVFITQYNYIYFGVSEWLLFNANSAIFQLYQGENKVIFN
jgi:hypothetical protein